MLFIQTACSQKIDYAKYAAAMSELTTFADNPGFKNEVFIEDAVEAMEWIIGEDGYNYTQDLEYIRFFGYKVLYESNNNFIVAVYYDAEGTAVYSYLFNMTATSNKLVLNEVIAGGDRCHNAVQLDEVTMKNNIISFSTFVTPNKLINWYNQADEHNDFPDCMVCCIGFANFKYDLKRNKKEFESLMIIEEALEEGSIIKNTYDKFVKDRPLKLSLLLNEEDLQKFINICLR